MIPYREEMAKRHLKVPGDLGRVVFVVRVVIARSSFKSADKSLGIRPAEY